MSEKHGEGETPLYRLWVRTVYKCTRPKNVQFKRYGGAGITICKDWTDSFSSFKNWALANGYAEGKKIHLKEGSTEFNPNTSELRFSVRSKHNWTVEQEKYLFENYRQQSRTEIAKVLDKTPQEVSARVTALGLNKRGKPVRHGDSTSKLYKLWSGIKSRCHSEKNAKYSQYGGKGIILVEDWHDWATFRNWALANGYDGKLLLNRKDLKGPYGPNNCVFADAKMRQSHKKWPAESERYLIDNYPTKTAREVGEAIGKTESQVLAMACLLRKRGLMKSVNDTLPANLTLEQQTAKVETQDNLLSDNDHLLGQSEGLHQSDDDILNELEATGHAN